MATLMKTMSQITKLFGKPSNISFRVKKNAPQQNDFGWKGWIQKWWCLNFELFFLQKLSLTLKFQNTKYHASIDENESNKDVDRIVRKYKNHPSVTAIKQAFPDLPFSFTPVVREVY